jgi:hypothetical protein
MNIIQAEGTESDKQFDLNKKESSKKGGIRRRQMKGNEVTKEGSNKEETKADKNEKT